MSRASRRPGWHRFWSGGRGALRRDVPYAALRIWGPRWATASPALAGAATPVRERRKGHELAEVAGGRSQATCTTLKGARVRFRGSRRRVVRLLPPGRVGWMRHAASTCSPTMTIPALPCSVLRGALWGRLIARPSFATLTPATPARARIGTSNSAGVTCFANARESLALGTKQETKSLVHVRTTCTNPSATALLKAT